MRTVLLAGGLGTRAYPFTASLPKPMMPVAGKPIIRHVMDIYARQGFTDFILSVGYLKEVILDYFDCRDLGYSIEIVDTGEDADTGDRIGRLRDRLTEPFMVTYSDGVCDVDLHRLIDFHNAHGGDVTLTSVPLRSQYGTVDLDPAGCVQAFNEKPILPQHRINAGFFVMNPSVFDDWPEGSLEQDVLPRLAGSNRVFAYSHTGYFKSMDTMKDQQELDDLIASGEAPWTQPSRDLA